MMIRRTLQQVLALLLALFLIPPHAAAEPGSNQVRPFQQTELDQILAPIALYPDELLSQILIASTYPLEVVQADRWAKKNKNLKSAALTSALEKQEWDPGVKSLVNFPQVLQMMSDKLDWTQKLGDAFLAQQRDVMDTVQNLRKKALDEGHLKTTDEQTVDESNEGRTIVIAATNPQVVYVPTYNPSVVYGTWWHPAYPPYYHYPHHYHQPGYTAGTVVFSFGVGVAIGAAWGYAWGGCHWGRNEVDIDINRNVNINRNIDRSKYADKVSIIKDGRSSWKHNPQHRKGVAYRDSNTAAQFNRGKSRNTQYRETYRGRTQTGRKDPIQGAGGRTGPASGSGRQSYQRSSSTGPFNRGSSQRRQYSGQGSRRSTFGGYESRNRTSRHSQRGRSSISASGWSGSGMGRGGGSRGGGSRGRR